VHPMIRSSSLLPFSRPNFHRPSTSSCAVFIHQSRNIILLLGFKLKSLPVRIIFLIGFKLKNLPMLSVAFIELAIPRWTKQDETLSQRCFHGLPSNVSKCAATSRCDCHCGVRQNGGQSLIKAFLPVKKQGLGPMKYSNSK
jgi:hypothetical protein